MASEYAHLFLMEGRGKLRSLQSKEPTTVTTEEAEAIVKKQILTILLVSNIFFVANVRER